MFNVDPCFDIQPIAHQKEPCRRDSDELERAGTMMDLKDDKTACCRIHCHHGAANADNVSQKVSTAMWAVEQVRRTGGLGGFGFVR